MMSKKVIGAGLAILLSVVGTAGSAAAQEREGRDRTTATLRGGMDFRSSKWLMDREVVNNNDEEIADVSDLILDRGSGRIDYAVLKTGTILGLGGKQVAVPFASLGWDAADEQFVLPMTEEQLKQLPEFTEAEWAGVIDTKAEAGKLRQRLMTDASTAARDPYAASLGDAKQIRIKGEVTKVERVSRGEFGEHVIITVKTEDGDRRVALGPSWFVNSGAFAPMRGDTVTVEALTLPRDTEQTLVARSLRAGDREMVLRGDDGMSAWTVSKEGTPETRAHAARRYLLVSALNGARVDCRGTECGKVYDTIAERNSGTVAFLSIDPNENFLGIADTKRLVPWSVVSVATDDIVRLDASKEMVLASSETPSDLSTLNSGGTTDMVYRAYEVSAPKFEPRRMNEGAAKPATDAWSHGGVILAAIKKDSPRTVSGKSRGTREVKFTGEVPSAQAITVTESGQDVLVVLGPSWYMKNQEMACKSGADVVVETYRTTIDGKDYLIARTVKCNGSTLVMIDESGSPAWDRR